MATKKKTKGNVSGIHRVKNVVGAESDTQVNDADQKAKEPEVLPSKKEEARKELKAEIDSQSPDVINRKVKKLNDLQNEISKNLDTFLDVVIYLNTIQEEKLWMYKLDEDKNPLYTTFEQFISSEFDIKRSYYSRLNSAARAYRLLEETIGEKEIQKYPKTCSFYYELSRVGEDDYAMVVEEAAKGKDKDKDKDKDKKQIKGTDIKRIIREKKLSSSKASNKKADPKRQLEIVFGIINKLQTPDISILNSKFFEDGEKDSKKTIIENMKRLIDQLEKE